MLTSGQRDQAQMVERTLAFAGGRGFDVRNEKGFFCPSVDGQTTIKLNLLHVHAITG